MPSSRPRARPPTAPGSPPRASLVYLANELRVRDRAVPYSLVAAVDEPSWRAIACGGASCGEAAGAPGSTPIVLNEWTARELGARVGDTLSLAYYLWHEEGSLETRSAEFRVQAVVPIAGAAADRELVPDYPGHHEGDPPRRLGPAVRGRPLARAAAGRGLLAAVPDHSEGVAPARRGAVALGTPAGPHDVAPARARRRLGSARSIPRRSLAISPRGSTPPRAVSPPRTSAPRALEAARGATDFGQYFVYFSFFLVVAALLLAGLFFRYGLEQRLGELGVLRAVGFTEARLRVVFLAEAALLATAGALAGMAGAVGYAWLMMLGLRTVWLGAVGTRSLALAVGGGELATGALAGIAAALLSVVLTLRGLRGRSVRSLLARAPQEWSAGRGRRRSAWAAVLERLPPSCSARGSSGA